MSKPDVQLATWYAGMLRNSLALTSLRFTDQAGCWINIEEKETVSLFTACIHELSRKHPRCGRHLDKQAVAGLVIRLLKAAGAHSDNVAGGAAHHKVWRSEEVRGSGG